MNYQKTHRGEREMSESLKDIDPTVHSRLTEVYKKKLKFSSNTVTFEDQIFEERVKGKRSNFFDALYEAISDDQTSYKTHVYYYGKTVPHLTEKFLLKFKGERLLEKEEKEKEKEEIQKDILSTTESICETYAVGVDITAGKPSPRLFFKEKQVRGDLFYLAGEEDFSYLPLLQLKKKKTYGEIVDNLCDIETESMVGLYKEKYDPTLPPLETYIDPIGNKYLMRNICKVQPWHALADKGLRSSTSLPQDIEEYFEFVYPHEHEREILLDWIAASFLERPLETYLFLLSDRASGKSTLNVIMSLLKGRDEVIVYGKHSNKDMFDSSNSQPSIRAYDDIDYWGTLEGFNERKGWFSAMASSRKMKKEAVNIKRTWNYIVTLNKTITDPRLQGDRPTHLQTDDRRAVMIGLKEKKDQRIENKRRMEGVETLASKLVQLLAKDNLSQEEHEYIGQIGFFFHNRLLEIQGTPRLSVVADKGYKGGLFYTTCIKSMNRPAREIITYLLYGEKHLSPMVATDLKQQLGTSEEIEISYETACKIYARKEKQNRATLSSVQHAVTSFLYKGEKIFTYMKKNNKMYFKLGNKNDIEFGEYGKE